MTRDISYSRMVNTPKSTLPTKDVLLNRLRRSNYQAYIWKHFFVNNLHMPSFGNHGWLIQGERLGVKWMKLHKMIF